LWGHFEDDARSKTPVGASEDKMELGLLVDEREEIQK